MSTPTGLPKFDSYGNLPPGIYPVPLEAVLARFNRRGRSSRQALSQSLTRLYTLVSGLAAGLYIDGSYITAAANPQDVDIILVLPDTFSPLTPLGQQLDDVQTKKTVYHLHIFPFKQTLQASAIRDMCAFWQKDREGHPKGIIYVEVPSRGGHL